MIRLIENLQNLGILINSVVITLYNGQASVEHLKKLFDRFYRVENATHTVKGTGLGLQLVKTTIEKHHQGKVFVTSVVGEGSTFGFTLPLHIKEDKLQEIEL